MVMLLIASKHGSRGSTNSSSAARSKLLREFSSFKCSLLIGIFSATALRVPWRLRCTAASVPAARISLVCNHCLVAMQHAAQALNERAQRACPGQAAISSNIQYNFSLMTCQQYQQHVITSLSKQKGLHRVLLLPLLYDAQPCTVFLEELPEERPMMSRYLRAWQPAAIACTLHFCLFVRTGHL
jgi:hypothetical protein